jgi:hypothetical protein
MKRTLSGRMVINGLTDRNAITSENAKYLELLHMQIHEPQTEVSNTGGAVEVRFVMDKGGRSAWIWCKSQYVAAKILFGNTDKKSRSRVQRLVYEGDYRDFRINQWIVRPSMQSFAPAHRGWPLLRRAVRTFAVYKYWAHETMKPTSQAQARREQDFTNMDAVETRYVGF